MLRLGTSTREDSLLEYTDGFADPWPAHSVEMPWAEETGKDLAQTPI